MGGFGVGVGVAPPVAAYGYGYGYPAPYAYPYVAPAYPYYPYVASTAVITVATMAADTTAPTRVLTMVAAVTMGALSRTLTGIAEADITVAVMADIPAAATAADTIVNPVSL